MEKETLQKQIGLLQLIKMQNIQNINMNKYLISSFKYISIVDVLLMPLYYVWQIKDYGGLAEIYSKGNMAKVYEEFKHDAGNNILKIIVLLNEKNNIIRQICDIDFVNSLFQTYKSIYAELSNNNIQL